MQLSSKAKHRRPSKVTRIAAFAGVTGVAIAAPLLGATGASAATTAQWDEVAQCESGGNWSINTGNGFFGGLQFTPSTWAAFGGTQYASSAHQATKAQQIAVAEKVLASQGPGAWPSCGVGLSSSDADTSKAPAAKSDAGSNGGNAPVAQSESTRSVEDSAPAAPQPSKPEQSTNSSDTGVSDSGVTFKKGDGEYEVKEGDTLFKIAKAEKVSGGWEKVFGLNKDIVKDADVIYPGQQLHLS